MIEGVSKQGQITDPLNKSQLHDWRNDEPADQSEPSQADKI